MKVRVWIEVFTTQRLTEETYDVSDDEWAAMTLEDRESYMCGLFEELRDAIANGSYEVVKD